MAVRVELEGRLGSEPSVREVNGRDFVELSVAVSQGYWSKAEDKWVDQGTVWYRVHPTSRRAGEEARLLHKGDAVVVAGTQSVEEFTRQGWHKRLRHQGERGRHLREPHPQEDGRLARSAYTKASRRP